MDRGPFDSWAEGFMSQPARFAECAGALGEL